MFFRFLLVGGTGFLVDAGLTYLFVKLGVAPWLARIPAIALAALWTWLANRYFTYEVKAARSSAEALRYAAVAGVMAVVNYLIYLGGLRVGLPPLAAVTIATACQTVISFHAYRHLVFKTRSEP